MGWLERMNRVLDYIEQHLEDTIDYEEIGKISLCSSGLFQRIFANLTGLSLSEYIRRRRLSKAGMELKNSKTKIIELALKYGYESADAFAFAFKRLHGINPSDARDPKVGLKNYPRLSVTLIIKGEQEMKYRIIERDAFSVVGKSILTTQEENKEQMSIPKFWDKSYLDGTIATLCELAKNKPLLGVCYSEEMDGTFHYMIGVETDNSSSNLERIVMPKSTWAVFLSVGPMPYAIQEVWKQIFNEFLPTQNYDHARTPDFELYFEGDNSKDSYQCEVWIPIVPKQEKNTR